METITLEKKGAVAWVWLDRPRRLNALNGTSLTELRQTFEELDRDEAIKAIVLAGRGPVFCAGFDVTWMSPLDSATVAREVSGVEAVYDVIESCTQPLIAAVQGPAMGGGLLLTLVADFCLASEEASFGAPEIKIGIFPNLRLVPRLERIVGLRAAKRIVLTGDPVDATTAQVMGLAERVLPVETLYSEAGALAETLSSLPPNALQLAKRAFSRAHSQDFVTWEQEKFTDCWARPERAAAMQAFLGRK